MTKLATFVLAASTVLLLGSTNSLRAQPLFKSVNSLEYLLGNASAVFVGVPHSVGKHGRGDDAWVAISFAAEETLKGEYVELPRLTYKLGKHPRSPTNDFNNLRPFRKTNTAA